MLASGREILFQDETWFTTKTLLRSTYAPQRENLTFDDKLLQQPKLQVCAVVSARKGLEHWELYETALNQELFLGFLRNLKSKTKRRKVALYMDNLNVHQTSLVTSTMDQLKLDYIYNAPYSPETNPIELCFAYIKQEYKKRRLQKLVTGESYDPVRLIEETLQGIDNKVIKSICAKGVERLRL